MFFIPCANLVVLFCKVLLGKFVNLVAIVEAVILLLFVVLFINDGFFVELLLTDTEVPFVRTCDSVCIKLGILVVVGIFVVWLISIC